MLFRTRFLLVRSCYPNNSTNFETKSLKKFLKLRWRNFVQMGFFDASNIVFSVLLAFMRKSSENLTFFDHSFGLSLFFLILVLFFDVNPFSINFLFNLRPCMRLLVLLSEFDSFFSSSLFYDLSKSHFG